MTQLALEFAPSLPERLRGFGLSPATEVVLHTNRRVLVSFASSGALRVHRGYAAAPDEVVAAIARWARPRARRADRIQAQRILTRFPVHAHAPPTGAPRRVPEDARPGDDRLLRRLYDLHAHLNDRHFEGVLGPVDIRLSGRMRRRLGEFRPPGDSGERPEIALGRRHIQRDGWSRATETLLHEMVHQWQGQTGRRLGHGAEFRQKCASVGIEGRALARLGNDFRRYLIPEG